MKPKTDNEPRAVYSLSLKKRIVEEIDRLADEHEMSRQKLVEAILEQVLYDKSFVLRVKE